MQRKFLEGLNSDEIDEYAGALGIDVSKERGSKAKIDLIERRRERMAEIPVFGMTFKIPVKRLHDKNVTDRLDGSVVTDEELFAIFEMVIGSDQLEALIERCTDEDGTVDNNALGLAFRKIVYSDELKNF